MAKAEKVQKVTEVQLTLSEDEANALTAMLAKSGYNSHTHDIFEALFAEGFEGRGFKLYATGMYQVQRV